MNYYTFLELEIKINKNFLSGFETINIKITPLNSGLTKKYVQAHSISINLK